MSDELSLDPRTENRVRQYLTHRSLELNQSPETLGTSIVVYYSALDLLQHKVVPLVKRYLTPEQCGIIQEVHSLPYATDTVEFLRTLSFIQDALKKVVQSFYLPSPAAHEWEKILEVLGKEIYQPQGIQDPLLLKRAEAYVQRYSHKLAIKSGECIARILLADEYLITALEDIAYEENCPEQ